MKKSIYILLVFLVTSLVSCEDQLDINTDPDSLSPDQVTLQAELPVAISGIATTQDAYYAILGGMWSQIYAQGNTASQYKSFEQYNVTSTSGAVESGWANMYDALADVRNIKANAESQENWNYYLLTTVLEVYASQILTDLYGDIPYLEANDVNTLSPAYDTQEEVYNSMIIDLDEALAKDLSTSMGVAPAQDDFVFGGNMDNWIAFANTLKLKIYLRQSNVRSAVASSGINALLDSGVSFLDVDAGMSQYLDEANKSNPLYESNIRQLNTSTNLRASNTLHSFLDANSDPRIGSIYEPGKIALLQGQYLEAKDVDQTTIALANLSPLPAVYFISKAESFFLQAEALTRYKGGAGAKAKYDEGVIASFKKNPVFDADKFTVIEELDGTSFVAAGGAYEFPVGGTDEEKIESIIVQKWVTSYPGNGFESFIEQLRTGYPKISDVRGDDPSYIPGEFTYSIVGTTGGVFPQRLPLPNSEITRNPNSPDPTKVTDAMWWK